MPVPRRSFARALIGAVALLACLLAGGVAAPAEARTPAGGYAQRAFKATNAERVAVGLGALTEERCLRRAAVQQAKAMAAAQQMYHQDITKLLGSCGLVLVGENVAFGYGTGRSVVVDGWMHSPEHKANILEPAYTTMGIGARKGRDGRWYVSQVFGRRL